MYIYVYIYTCIYVYIYIHMYIYIYQGAHYLASLFLHPLIDLSALWTGMFSLSCELGLLWHNCRLELLTPLGPSYGMSVNALCMSPFFLGLFQHPSELLTSLILFLHSGSCTWNATEWPLLRTALNIL